MYGVGDLAVARSRGGVPGSGGHLVQVPVGVVGIAPHPFEGIQWYAAL